MLRWGKDKKADSRRETTPAPRGVAPPPGQAPPEKPERAPAQPAASDAPSQARTLEEVLIGAGTITQEQLDAALAKQRETGAFLGQILVDLGAIDENSLTSFLAKHCKIPHLSLLDYLIDEKQLELIPREVCLKYRLLPIDKLGKNLTLAMVNPLNREALEKVQELCPNLRIKPILCAWNHYEAVTRRLFGEKAKGVAEMTATDFGFSEKKKAEPAEKAAAEKPEAAQAPPEEVAHEEAPREAAPAAPEPEAEPAEGAPPEAPTEPVAPPQPEPVAAAPVEAPEPTPVPEPAPEPAVQPAPGAEEEAAAAAVEAVPGQELDREAVLGEVFKAEEEGPAAAGAAPTPERRPVAPGAAKGAAGSIMQEMISVMRDSMRDTYAMLARRMELFSGLSPEVVARIFAKGMTVEFDAGYTIFEKGEPGRELFVILGGKVEIRDGERLIATLSRGDMFGEMALISNEPRSAAAVAVETTSVLKLTYDVFDKVLSKETAVHLLVNIVITLSGRLRAANEYINAHLK